MTARRGRSEEPGMPSCGVPGSAAGGSPRSGSRSIYQTEVETEPHVASLLLAVITRKKKTHLLAYCRTRVIQNLYFPLTLQQTWQVPWAFLCCWWGLLSYVHRKQTKCKTGADPRFWSGGGEAQRSFDPRGLEPKICSKK